MPKMKTVKAARKRFKVSARGKVKYQPAGKQHLLSGKSPKRRRRMRRGAQFIAKHDVRNIKRCLLEEGR